MTEDKLGNWEGGKRDAERDKGRKPQLGRERRQAKADGVQPGDPVEEVEVDDGESAEQRTVCRGVAQAVYGIELCDDLVKGDGDAQLGTEADALGEYGEVAASDEELTPTSYKTGNDADNENDDNDAVGQRGAARHAAYGDGVEKVRGRLCAELAIGASEAAVGRAGLIAADIVVRDVGGAAGAGVGVRAELCDRCIVARAPRASVHNQREQGRVLIEAADVVALLAERAIEEWQRCGGVVLAIANAAYGRGGSRAEGGGVCRTLLTRTKGAAAAGLADREEAMRAGVGLARAAPMATRAFAALVFGRKLHAVAKRARRARNGVSGAARAVGEVAARLARGGTWLGVASAWRALARTE